MIKDLYIRLRSLFRHGAVESELDEELKFHIQHQIDKYVESGMTRDEAERRAQLRFGGIDQVREDCRDARGTHLIESLGQDFRYGARMLRKNPGFTIVAVVTLALGIGANTAIFSCVDAVLLRALPYSHADKLAIIWETNEKISNQHNVVAPPNYLDWQSSNQVFDDMTALANVHENVTGQGDPRQLTLQAVTTNFFSVLGVTPVIGRDFTAQEGQEGKDNVVIIGYGLWQKLFGGDPAIVGKSIQLNGHTDSIIGVAPQGFEFFIKRGSLTAEKPELWSPFVFPESYRHHDKIGRFLTVVGRLKPGVNFDPAQSEMNVVASRLAREYPDADAHWGINVVPLRKELSGEIGPALLILLGAVGFVLLIACANISSLLLARASAREREMAIRSSLGASRWRIARQLFVESLLLALVGGAAGVVLAFAGTRAILAVSPAGLLDIESVSISGRVLVFAAGAAVLSGILFGLLPSYFLLRPGAAEALKERGTAATAGRRRGRMRSAFVIVQVALALVLLAGSGLMIRSFARLMSVNPGFNSSHLLTFKLTLPTVKYRTDQSQQAFYQDTLARLRTLNGAASVTMDNYPPFTGMGAGTSVQVIGQPQRPASELPSTGVSVVGPDFFRTMETPLIQGRLFTQDELSEARHVVVVSKSFAENILGGANPLGQKVVIDMKDDNPPCEVVGVVGDVRDISLDAPAKPMAYWPYPELPYSQMTMMIRTPDDPMSLVPAVRSQILQVDRDIPMAAVETMDSLISDSAARSRFAMMLLSVFAGLAFILAAVGIYGVISYSVSQRTNEIGVRLALGASPRNLLGLVLKQGALLALVGNAFGLAAAFGLTRLMSVLLFGVTATDPLTFVSVVTLLTGVALTACYIPARRATKVDPVVALRYE